jgi:3-oxoacyl-[acyl-carrier-protein] synthase II
LTATHPEGEGAQRGMLLAMEEAGLTPADVDYVNMHATSTPMGDISELKALKGVFKDRSPKISATKSMTGHLLGAAGAIEAIAAVMAIREGIIPPTINTTNLDENTPEGLDIVLGKAVKTEVNVAISNTFGFGGHNAITLFKKYIA